MRHPVLGLSLLACLSFTNLAGCSSGSGSSPQVPGVSSSSSASSSSSSSSSSSGGLTNLACPEASCVLFDDAMVEGRGNLAAYEWRASNTGGYHFDGSQPSHVQWALVEEAGHGTVIEVTFNGNDPDELVADNGWFGITAGTSESTSMDLSAFADGAISFEMRILENGLVQDMLLLNMDCGYPCTSEEMWIADPAELGQWQTYNIPMQSLIASGLDITRVNNLFNFKPSWGQQLGQYVMQLDNIHLNKTHTDTSTLPERPAASSTKTYYQNGLHEESGLSITNSASASISEINEAESQFINIEFIADTPAPEFFIFPAAGGVYDMSNYFYGDMVFDLRVVSYGNNPGEFLVNSYCRWPCRAVPAYSIGRPEEGAWETHRIPVQELVARGLHLNRIQNGFFLKFEGPSRQGLHINLNNIRWEYTATAQ